MKKNLARIDKYEINGQSILLGDSLEIMPKLDTIFDACITDPPYNISGYDNKKKIGWLKSNNFWTDKKFNKIDEKWDKFSNKGYEMFTEAWLNYICKLVKTNGNIVIFGTYHNIYLIGYLLNKLNKKIINSIVWYKNNAFPNITQRMLCESTEHMIWAVNNDQRNAKNWTFNYNVLKGINGGKQMRNVWETSITPLSEKKFGKHPSQKPFSIISKLVLGLTNKNDKILDPFVGGGTIPIVCMKNNRSCLGVEKDKNYFLIAKNRLKNESKNMDLFI